MFQKAVATQDVTSAVGLSSLHYVEKCKYFFNGIYVLQRISGCQDGSMLRNCCSHEAVCTADLTDIPTACRLLSTIRK
jgi:hypothetical protein